MRCHQMVIMPNHFHCILEIVEASNPVNDNGSDAHGTTLNYIRNVKTLHWPPFDSKLWQRNYWEHNHRT